MIVVRNMWGHFEVIVNDVLTFFMMVFKLLLWWRFITVWRSLWYHFGGHLGVIWRSFWCHFGGHFGTSDVVNYHCNLQYILHFWCHLEVMLDDILTSFLISFWCNLEVMLRSFLRSGWNMICSELPLYFTVYPSLLMYYEITFFNIKVVSCLMLVEVIVKWFY